MKYLIFITFIISNGVLASGHPVCDSSNNWAATMAFVHLKNEKIINNENIDINLTQVKRIASEEIEQGLYKQVHEINFYKKSNEVISVLAVNNASHEECSMGPVKVYLIEKIVGSK